MKGYSLTDGFIRVVQIILLLAVIVVFSFVGRVVQNGIKEKEELLASLETKNEKQALIVQEKEKQKEFLAQEEGIVLLARSEGMYKAGEVVYSFTVE